MDNWVNDLKVLRDDINLLEARVYYSETLNTALKVQVKILEQEAKFWRDKYYEEYESNHESKDPNRAFVIIPRDSWKAKE